MSSVGLAVLWCYVANVPHIIGSLICGLVFRVPIENASLGCGPVLLRWAPRRIEWRLSAIPLGSYVKFVDVDLDATDARADEDEDEADDGEAAVPEDEPPEPRGAFHGQPLPIRMGIAVIGPIATALAGALFLGPERAWDLLLTSFERVVMASLDPDRAVQLWQALFGLCDAAPWTESFGVVLITVAAFNLLPIPTLGGGTCLMLFAEELLGLGERVIATLQWIGLLLLLGMLGAWGVAFVRAVL